MTYPSHAWLGLAVLSTSMLVACGSGGDEEAAPPTEQAVACGDLVSRFKSAESDVKIVSSTEVAAANNAPAYCDVRGTIRGSIQFAVFMPKDWNGRFQMVGNGGMAGSISFPAMNTAIAGRYAVSSTDTGHDGSIPAQSGARFGYDVEFGDDMEIDYGYRSVQLTSRVSKELIRAHYAEPIAYAYWNGCSTGGRQGMMASQRYPEEFDGYLIGAPVYNFTRQQMSAPAVLTHLYKNGINGGSLVPPAKRDLLGDIIYNGNGGNYAGCDAVDGLVDGQIRNPLQCNFIPSVHLPRCMGADGPNCFTNAQVEALEGVYRGRPEFGLYPIPVGAENANGGWNPWVINNAGTAPTLHSVRTGAFQYLLFQPDQPDFDYLTQWNWSSHPYLMDTAKQRFNATDPDLRKFAASGKKILMFHGWTDSAVNALGTLEYLTNVENVVGSHSAVNEFLKLYMVPGLGHCSGGPGHTQVNWLPSLVDWVENGKPPAEIIGTKPGTTSTRPHCPHPQEAVYNGTGDVNSAASFTCRAS